MSKQRKMILIAAAAGVISMFLPWWSVSIPLIGNESVSGMHGAGILVFLCFAAAGALAYMGNQTTNLNQTNWMMVLVAGGIAALITLIKFFDTPAFTDRGFGLYLALIAAIGIVAFTFMNRSATDNLQSGFDSLKEELNRKMNSTTNGAPNVSTTTVSHTPTDEPTRPAV